MRNRLVLLSIVASLFSAEALARSQVWTCEMDSWADNNVNIFATTNTSNLRQHKFERPEGSAGPYSCYRKSKKTGQYIHRSLSFAGMGVGIGVSAYEAITILYTGFGDITGNYYGARFQAAVGAGPSIMWAGKLDIPRSAGTIQIIGGNLFAVGFDLSAVRVIISED